MIPLNPIFYPLNGHSCRGRPSLRLQRIRRLENQSHSWGFLEIRGYLKNNGNLIYGYITGIILMGYMPHVDESWDIDGKYPRGSSKVIGVPPIIQVRNDHDLVLKPIVTWGTPILGPPHIIGISWELDICFCPTKLGYVAIHDNFQRWK